MPRTVNGLFDEIAPYRNLAEAYAKARKAGRFRPGQLEFEARYEDQLIVLERELSDGTYRPQPLHTFEIREPKRRTVSAAAFRDRVVHHAIVRVLEPIYERSFMASSYACRAGKGAHRALLDASSLARRFPFALKTDIRQFFPSIDHEILGAQLRRKIRCRRTLDLIGAILDNGKDELTREYEMVWFPGDEARDRVRRRGLPIGNLTSQFLANVYLDPLDHFVAERLGAGRSYLRYCDDFVVFGESIDALQRVREAIAKFLVSLRLILHPRKTHILPVGQGVPWLGFLVRPTGRRLLGAGARRLHRRLCGRMRAAASGRIEPETLDRTMASWSAHLDWGDTHGVERGLEFTRAGGLLS